MDLSKADQEIYELAKYIIDHPKELWTVATKAVGLYGMSEKTFGINVKRMLENPTTRRMLGQAGRKTLAQAVRIVGGEALAVAGSVIAAISTTALFIIGGLIIIGGLAFGYYWANYMGDQPVQLGPAMSNPVSTPVGVPGASSTGKFAVFLLPNNSGGTMWIGDETALKTLRGCDTPNGGLCDDPNQTYPPVAYVRESPDFDRYDQALAQFCSATTQEPGYWGNKAAGYGGHYWSEYPC